jgi:transcription termination/antitermination protein NusA
MNGDFIDALRQIEKEKGIPLDQLIETIESALASAYRRAFADGAEVRLRMDPRGKSLKTVLEKAVVDQVENTHREISLRDAQRRNPMVKIGETVDVEIAADGFGRIAAQTARQVLLQRIREAERERVYGEFAPRMGEVVTGIVQRREGRRIFVLLGKVEALLPPEEQVPGEPYRFNDRVKVLILKADRTTRGAQVTVSRSHPSLIRRLFELEVPEIEDGTVVIQNVAREAGARSKIAVSSTEDKVDPVGACVGHRGSRVQAVVNELYGEKIDIIRWHENPVDFIREALSPAKPLSVTLNTEAQSAYVVVPDTQLSLAIGKEGQNVRLAARLCGWRIDIRSEAQDRDRRDQEQAAQDAARTALAGALAEHRAADERVGAEHVAAIADDGADIGVAAEAVEGAPAGDARGE